jgi:hypothetical protein
MPNGGRRKGAGRPVESHTLLRLEMRRALVERAHKEMEELYGALFDLARGHWRVIDDPVTGQPIRVYKKGPNGEALAYLLDQVIDKSVQHIDFDGRVETEDRLSSETLAAINQAIAYAVPDKPKPAEGGPDRKKGR